MKARCTKLILLVAMLAACAGQEDLGQVELAGMGANGMGANGMGANGMGANGMGANGLNAGSMNQQNLDSLQDPGAGGDVSRMFTKYAVGCAFTVDQHFDFTWTDSSGIAHDESYPGLLGLAPQWATGPLDTVGAQWVSACLAARVNAFGEHVMLSLRGTHPALAVTQSELQHYNTREGVFFGNIFTADPKIYACYDPLDIVEATLKKRVCAQPQLGVYDCGIIHVLGPCYGLSLLGIAQVTLGYCSHMSSTLGYFFGCSPNALTTPAMPSITTFVANLL